ncbi:alpha/beta fold hydrolase [Nocardia harenae]|uniref:alpha/beta fold hydrolase n=1 Tax=Nocardia harenae TaxID=358707 RepID=UPI0008366D5E|nr:alpha/beta fold hydrolase [Nocardia harenae]
MSPLDDRHPSTVSDWSDSRRRARLRETRRGHDRTSWRRTWTALLRVTVLLLAGLVVFAQYWQHDVAPERDRLARTEPALLPVATPGDERNWDTVVVDLVGLGNLNAEPTAAALPALSELGVVWAVRYDQNGIDTKVIAELIVRAAQMSGLRNVILVGHSMGGVIALEVARHIHTDSDRRLLSVILDCTPLDLDAVRQESRGRGEDLVRWMGWLPGVRESRTLRTAAELYARRDRFITHDGALPAVDWPRFGTALDEVLRQKTFSADAASNGLIEAQFLAIVASGAGNDLRALREPRPGRTRPAIVLLRPRDPADDHIVLVDRTQVTLTEQAGAREGALLVVSGKIGHANPRQRPEAYDAMLTERVLPFLARYQQTARGAAALPQPR